MSVFHNKKQIHTQNKIFPQRMKIDSTQDIEKDEPLE